MERERKRLVSNAAASLYVSSGIEKLLGFCRVGSRHASTNRIAFDRFDAIVPPPPSINDSTFPERFDSTCKNIPPVPDEGRKMIGKVCANRSITWLGDRQRKTATSFSLQKLFVSVGFVILEKAG